MMYIYLIILLIYRVKQRSVKKKVTHSENHRPQDCVRIPLTPYSVLLTPIVVVFSE